LGGGARLRATKVPLLRLRAPPVLSLSVEQLKFLTFSAQMRGIDSKKTRTVGTLKRYEGEGLNKAKRQMIRLMLFPKKCGACPL
jgi:hypothetical protein